MTLDGRRRRRDGACTAPRRQPRLSHLVRPDLRPLPVDTLLEIATELGGGAVGARTRRSPALTALPRGERHDAETKRSNFCRTARHQVRPRAVRRHPRRGQGQGRAGRAPTTWCSTTAPASPASRCGASAWGRTAPTTWRVGDLATLTPLPWMPGYARIACDGHVQGQALCLLLARGAQAPARRAGRARADALHRHRARVHAAASDGRRQARARSTTPTRSTSPATTTRACRAQRAFLERADRLAARGRHRRLPDRPRGRERPVRDQLHLRRRAEDRRPLHLLQDGGERDRQRDGHDLHVHAQAVLATAPAPARTSTSRSATRKRRTCSTTTATSAASALSQTGLPLPRRPARSTRRRWPRSARRPSTPTSAWWSAARCPARPGRRPTSPTATTTAPPACASRTAASSCACRTARCNPYLATAAIIAAGLDGIDRKLDPGEPINVNLYELIAGAARRSRASALLPQNLQRGARRARGGRGGRGRRSAPSSPQEFIALKRMEWIEYSRHVSDWETRPLPRDFLKGRDMCGIVGLLVKKPALRDAARRTDGADADRHDRARAGLGGHGGVHRAGRRGPRASSASIRAGAATSTGRPVHAPRERRDSAAHAAAVKATTRCSTTPPTPEAVRALAAGERYPACTCCRSGRAHRPLQGHRHARPRSPRATTSRDFSGTHLVGHTRMATESAVTPAHAHPVHRRRGLLPGAQRLAVQSRTACAASSSRCGIRFETDNDTEAACRFLEWRMREGDDLEAALQQRLRGARRLLHLPDGHRRQAGAGARPLRLQAGGGGRDRRLRRDRLGVPLAGAPARRQARARSSSPRPRRCTYGRAVSTPCDSHFDLAHQPLRELNQFLHGELPASDARSVERRATRTARTTSPSASMRRSQIDVARPRRLLRRRHEQAGHASRCTATPARAWPRT